MAAAPCLGGGGDKKHRWITANKAAGKYVREARTLMAMNNPRALSLLDAALSLSPRMESAMEMKARCLLQLRRFKEVVDLLQDYIPSLKVSNEDSSSITISSSSSDSFASSSSRERAKLLPGDRDVSGFKCFSVSELKERVMGGIWKRCDKQGCLVLGQACCHLGLLEDAMVLLRNGKRLATAEFRRESVSLPDDSFSLSMTEAISPPTSLAEIESVTQLLSQIKLLIRRRTAAIAAIDAGLHSEAVRHFSKILDGRSGRGVPQGFLAECYMHRATAYRSLGRIAESIADCNRTLSLESGCIQALETRSALLEQIQCLPDCLHDLEHMKLLYNTILRDRKLPGPAWKRHYVHYREIPGRLCALTIKIQGLRQRIASGETGNVDYYVLMGLRQGCSRSDLEMAHRLLSLKHKPDNAFGFIEKCEFADERDVNTVKDRAGMLAMLLYRLIQKGYNNISAMITAEKERAALQAIEGTGSAPNPSVFQGVFYRDLAAVSSLLTQVGIHRRLPVVNYEALAF